MKSKDEIRKSGRERMRKWRRLNHEKSLEANRKWRKENPEKMKKAKKRWDDNNKERIRITDKLWRDENREKVRITNKKASLKYHKNNPEVSRHAVRIRRFRKKNNEGYFTTKEWEDLKKEHNHTCLCCKKKEPKIKLVPDHVIPLSKSGNNYIQNIQPLCERCNSIKWSKIVSLVQLRELVKEEKI